MALVSLNLIFGEAVAVWVGEEKTSALGSTFSEMSLSVCGRLSLWAASCVLRQPTFFLENVLVWSHDLFKVLVQLGLSGKGGGGSQG